MVVISPKTIIIPEKRKKSRQSSRIRQKISLTTRPERKEKKKEKKKKTPHATQYGKKKQMLTSLGGSFTGNLQVAQVNTQKVPHEIFLLSRESQPYLGERVLCQTGVKDGIRNLVPRGILAIDLCRKNHLRRAQTYAILSG